MSVVAIEGAWVEANFMETDMTDIRVGQPVSIEIDTYPGLEWQGRVKSISQATGAEFSILPPQNASGNWVKITQRISVRIAVDSREDDPPLRAGSDRSQHAHVSDTASPTSPRAGHPPLILCSVMLTTVITAIDATIANVALPHMQGSLSATQDQISWVLTSYIVATAIFIPPTGFLATRIGRQRLMLSFVGDFLVAAMLLLTIPLCFPFRKSHRLPPAERAVSAGAEH